MLNIFHGWLQEVGPLVGGGPEDHAATTLGLHVGPIPARPPVPALASLAVSRQVVLLIPGGIVITSFATSNRQFLKGLCHEMDLAFDDMYVWLVLGLSRGRDPF